MSCYIKDSFCVEILDQMYYFYTSNNKIYLEKYSNYTLVEEHEIIKECKVLNSIFITNDNNIYIIYSSLNDDLILEIMFEDNIVNKIILVKNISDFKFINIISVNNYLNIFYIQQINKKNILCYRGLNNKLRLTPSIIVDSVNFIDEKPFIISESDNKIGVCYVKDNEENSLGYRTLDLKINVWSNFKILDNVPNKIRDINFILKGNEFVYSYIYNSDEDGRIIFGIASKENIERGNIDEIGKNIEISNVFLSSENKFFIIYKTDKLMIKEVNYYGNIKFVNEILVENIINFKKCSFSTDKNLYINNILIVKTEEFDIYTDSRFVNNIINRNDIEEIKHYKYEMAEVVKEDKGYNEVYDEFIDDYTDVDYEIENINNEVRDNYEAIEENDVIIAKGEINDIIEDSNENNYSDDKEIIMMLISKIKEYEELINNLTNNFMIADEEKKRLLENIDYLNSELNNKNYRINRFETALIEKQDLILSYENKIEELSNIINNIE